MIAASLIPPLPLLLSATAKVSVLIAFHVVHVVFLATPQAHLVCDDFSMDTNHFPTRYVFLSTLIGLVIVFMVWFGW